MWSRKWQRLEGISCIKQRVLLRPTCSWTVLKHFSLASDPEPTPWDLSNTRSDPLPWRVQKPNNWIQEQTSAVHASSLVPTHSSLGTHCSSAKPAFQNGPFFFHWEMEPWICWENFTLIFPWGQPVISEKLGARPGQENGKTVHEGSIIFTFTHKEQIWRDREMWIFCQKALQQFLRLLFLKHMDSILSPWIN
jgi:hypothetical protein